MTIYNFAMLNVPFANGAISTEIAPFPDWNRGLGIAFEQTEGKPEMKGLNGLFQVLTTSVLYLKQRGISEWDSTLEYPANAFAVDGARLYKSKRTNTNKQPSLSQLDWDVWASIADVGVSTNGNLKKTTATSGAVTLEVPTATDAARGAMRFATSAEAVNRSNVQAAVRPSDVPALNNTLTSTSTTQALTAAQGRALNMQMLGVGQTWQNVTGSRSLGVTYTNTTGRPIMVSVSLPDTGSQNPTVTINVGGVDILVNNYDLGQGSASFSHSFIVPSGASYRISVNISVQVRTWAELR